MYSSVVIYIFVAVFGNACTSENTINKSVEHTEIIINDFFDDNLSDMVPIIKKFRFDPMILPNISTEITGLTVNLTNGIMLGASNLTRGGDTLISFYPEFWRFQAKIYLEELQCKFNYTAGRSFFGFYSGIEGAFNSSIKNVTTTMSVDLSIPTFILYNPQIHIDKISMVLVNMGSESIGSIFYSLVVNLAIPVFQKKIIEVAESTARQVANVTITMLNNNINHTISNINQYVESILARLTYIVTGNKTPQDTDRFLAPYFKNVSNIQSKDNPFQDLDRWLSSTWNKTVLIWNESFGTQSRDTSIRESDKWIASSSTPKPSESKPTDNPFSELDKWIASHLTPKPSGSKPTIPEKNKPTKKTNNLDILSNFDRILQESWVDTVGNKLPGEVFASIIQQAYNETIKESNAPKKKASAWDKWKDSLAQSIKY